MDNKAIELSKLWNWTEATPCNESDIRNFEQINNLIIPKDLRDFFVVVNGSNGYDEGLFQFYSLDKFEAIDKIFPEWKLIANYDNFINNFNQHKSCFVFANYQFHLFSYVIELDKFESKQNKIYIFCGADYKIIANTFSEFLDLCLTDSKKLFFTE